MDSFVQSMLEIRYKYNQPDVQRMLPIIHVPSVTEFNIKSPILLHSPHKELFCNI